MKFQSPKAFEKHAKESNLFLLISPCNYERHLWTTHLLELFRKKDVNLQLKQWDALETSPPIIQDEIRAPTLWKAIRVFLIDAIDKTKPIQPFLNILDHQTQEVVLIFRASSAKPLTELSSKKNIIVLDVSEEKPWNRSRRLQEWLRDQAYQESKRLSPDVAEELLQYLGTDLATLHQELKKLITYIGSKIVIESQDIEAICGSKDLLTGWQLAETVVWKHPIECHEKMTDLGFVFPFLGQIRYHLQLGAQIANLLERKVNPVDLKQHLLSGRSQNLDKFIPIAIERTSMFFLQGLIKLYELELAAKSTPLDLTVLFDVFQAKFYEKAYPSSQHSS